MTDSKATRWQYLDHIRHNPGPFSIRADSQEPGISELSMDVLSNAKALVIGAGGLGCEILKNLALSGFKNIHVIDMDTIDVSNLNRQFLFRKDDVGKYKAEVAAAFVERRVRGVKITPHNYRMQELDRDFYMQFQVVICGLDSIEARRWINSTLVDMVDGDNQDSMKPFIDGGTEGFKGQTRVIFPTMSPCIECQLDLYTPRPAVPLCTLATIPRQPEHCIEWAHIIAWDQENPFPQLDKDDPEHITWLYQKAAARAEEFGISGVTYSLTQGVVKNIIPAIASTNAIIAASCCNEAWKIVTAAATFLGMEESYMMYSGDDGIYTTTFKYDKQRDCAVCGQDLRLLSVDPEMKLRELLDSFAAKPDLQLKKPSIRAEGKTLYMQFPPSLEAQTRGNLDKTLTELGLETGHYILVTDPTYPGIRFNFAIHFNQSSTTTN
ncbi:NEDD8-activating enzyme E1 catalytic subunit [Xylaria nigripes]|nr:NEDD8-activating enzyme E1 catalytic subunit [Xylaria nigripes]